MKKEDWNKLDNLLKKEGFGGYYDVVETLKIVGESIKNERVKRDEIDQDWAEELENKMNNLGTIDQMMSVVLALTVNFDYEKELEESELE